MTAATAFYLSRHPGSPIKAGTGPNPGSSKSGQLSAKSHFWLPDSSGMTTVGRFKAAFSDFRLPTSDF